MQTANDGPKTGGAFGSGPGHKPGMVVAPDSETLRHEISEIESLVSRNRDRILKRFKVLAHCADDPQLAKALRSGAETLLNDQKHCVSTLKRVKWLVRRNKVAEAQSTIDHLLSSEHTLLEQCPDDAD